MMNRSSSLRLQCLVGSVLVAALVTTSTGVARAVTPAAGEEVKKPAPPPVEKTRAKAITLAKAGKFTAAAGAFEKAYLASGDPNNLFDAGIAWDKAGDAARASLALQRYVSAAPKGDKVARARARIEELKPKVAAAAGLGTLVITTSNPGARVMIDGRDAGTAPLSVELAAGDHTVQVSLTGYLTYTAPVTVTAGVLANIVVHLDLDPDATPAIPATAPAGTGTGVTPGATTSAAAKTHPSGGGGYKLTDKFWFWGAVGGVAAVVVTVVIIAAVPAPYNEVPESDLGIQEFRR